MNSSAVFVDANVLLEAVLLGRKNAKTAQQFLSSNRTVISPLSAHLLMYIGQKDGLALNILTDLLVSYKFTDFSTSEIRWASINHQGDDFEDALQVACAVTGGSQLFATFDKKLAQRYQQFITMKVLSPKVPS